MHDVVQSSFSINYELNENYGKLVVSFLFSDCGLSSSIRIITKRAAKSEFLAHFDMVYHN